MKLVVDRVKDGHETLRARRDDYFVSRGRSALNTGQRGGYLTGGKDRPRHIEVERFAGIEGQRLGLLRGARNESGQNYCGRSDCSRHEISNSHIEIRRADSLKGNLPDVISTS